MEGPAEPLGPVLEGPAEPLDAILRGLAEPLKLFSDSHGTQASAQCRPSLHGGSLSAGQYRSGTTRNTHRGQNHPEWTAPKNTCRCLTLHRFHLFPGGGSSGIQLSARDRSGHLGCYQLSGFRRRDVFFNADVLNLLLSDWAILSR